VVFGTVEGDVHDIGKNLVIMMMQGAGFEVHDLGTNVSSEKFYQAVQNHKPDLFCMSALLTTTQGAMGRAIQFLQEKEVRQTVKVMVGGAPLTEAFAREIGADGYAPDAGTAVERAKVLLGLK
jgi:5-methyltetrahydrofolate--homocysteine methyltransferase